MQHTVKKPVHVKAGWGYTAVHGESWLGHCSFKDFVVNPKHSPPQEEKQTVKLRKASTPRKPTKLRTPRLLLPRRVPKQSNNTRQPHDLQHVYSEQAWTEIALFQRLSAHLNDVPSGEQKGAARTAGVYPLQRLQRRDNLHRGRPRSAQAKSSRSRLTGTYAHTSRREQGRERERHRLGAALTPLSR